MTHKELTILLYYALEEGAVSFAMAPNNGGMVCRIGCDTFRPDSDAFASSTMRTASSLARTLLAMQRTEPYRAGYMISRIKEEIAPEEWA